MILLSQKYIGKAYIFIFFIEKNYPTQLFKYKA
jgi:hypothetical protein